MLSTRWLPTISSHTPTIGVLVLARCAAIITRSPAVKIRSTFCATRSAASAGSVSFVPVLPPTISRRLRPASQRNSAKSRSMVKVANTFGLGARTQITHIPFCCASPGTGREAAAAVAYLDKLAPSHARSPDLVANKDHGQQSELRFVAQDCSSEISPIRLRIPRPSRAWLGLWALLVRL